MVNNSVLLKGGLLDKETIGDRNKAAIEFAPKFLISIHLAKLFKLSGEVLL